MNGVKLELGIVLALGLLLWLVLLVSGLPAGVQIGAGFAFGLVGMLWLILRARIALRRHLHQVSAGQPQLRDPEL